MFLLELLGVIRQNCVSDTVSISTRGFFATGDLLHLPAINAVLFEYFVSAISIQRSENLSKIGHIYNHPSKTSIMMVGNLHSCAGHIVYSICSGEKSQCGPVAQNIYILFILRLSESD